MNEPKKGVDVLVEYANGEFDIIEIRRPNMSPGWRMGRQEFATWPEVESQLTGFKIHEITEIA